MNYGCGSTVNPSDLANNPKILYVGVGGGMELLQFAYFNRNRGGVVGVVVEELSYRMMYYNCYYYHYHHHHRYYYYNYYYHTPLERQREYCVVVC